MEDLNFNPFKKEELLANIALQEKRNQTRRNKRRQVYNQALASKNLETNVKLEAALKKMNMNEFIENQEAQYEKTKARLNSLPNTLNKITKNTAVTVKRINNLTKRTNNLLAKIDKENIEIIRGYPKANALPMLNKYIQIHRNLVYKGLANERKILNNAKKQLENETSRRSQNYLASYNPNNTSKAQNNSIKSKLRNEKTVRNESRKILNEEERKLNVREKQIRNMYTRKLKQYQNLKKEIEGRKN